MITLTDEPTEEKGEVQAHDEQRLEKLRARGKSWNNNSLVFFGCAVVWLLLLKYADLEPIIGAVNSLYLLIFTMILAVISVILSAFFTWRARTLRKEIEYYSTDPEPEDDPGQTEIPE